MFKFKIDNDSLNIDQLNTVVTFLLINQPIIDQDQPGQLQTRVVYALVNNHQWQVPYDDTHI